MDTPTPADLFGKSDDDSLTVSDVPVPETPEESPEPEPDTRCWIVFVDADGKRHRVLRDNYVPEDH